MPNEMFTDEEVREQATIAKPPTALNPFGSTALANQASNTLAATDQSRAIAETQAAMVIAKRFPRDQVAAMDRILNAFTRPTLAEAAMYSYSRGGTEITGPSIRSAETLAQLWGNVQFGIRELEQRPGESTVEAYAWDIETNTRQVKVFQVPHLRFTKKGSYKLEDPRDIYELVANQGARRLRACILGIIPGDVVESAMDQAEVTLKTKAEVTPERLQKLVEMFAAFGVPKEAIEKRIQRRIDAITPALLINLGKIHNSIRDGMSSPADWFEIEAGAAAGSAPEAPARGAAGLKAATAKPKGGATKLDTPDVTEAGVMDDMQKASNKDTLDAAASLVDALSDPDAKKRCIARYHELLAALPQ